MANKRQLSFYAETDVDLYLSLAVSPKKKTRQINDALRLMMCAEARVDLGDGNRPVRYAELSEKQQDGVNQNLVRHDLSLPDVDDHLWEIVRETATRDNRENAARYLALHEAKFGKPFRIKSLQGSDS